MTENDEFSNEWSPEEKAKALEFLASPLFRKLTKAERAKIIYVMRTPGEQELDMLMRIWGHTPSQVVHIMAKEFAERFSPGYSREYLDFVSKRLTPSHTWSELDTNIAASAKSLFHVTDMEGALDFWDKMRYLLQALPKRREPKDLVLPGEMPRKARQRQKPRHGWKYEVCKFCWRTVPVNTDVKKKRKVRCFLHSLENVGPSDSTYRKYSRLQESVNAAAFELEGRLCEMYPRQITSAFEREAARTLNWFHLTSPKSLLENLMKYIKEELRQYDLAAMERDEACRLILETFHGPFDTSADAPYREAMAAYIHDRVYFETLIDIPQLALAEAWLGALSRDRRRKGETANNI